MTWGRVREKSNTIQGYMLAKIRAKTSSLKIRVDSSRLNRDGNYNLDNAVAC